MATRTTRPTRTEVAEVHRVDPATGEITPVRQVVDVPEPQAPEWLDAADPQVRHLILTGRFYVGEEDSEAVARAIAQRILDMDPDRVLDDVARPVGLRTLVGERITIHGVEWCRSAYDGPGIFAVLQATSELRREPFLVTTGARNVMAQLARLADGDKFPVEVVVTEQQTRSGYSVLWLRSPK
jgi:hypothetical protein